MEFKLGRLGVGVCINHGMTICFSLHWELLLEGWRWLGWVEVK